MKRLTACHADQSDSVKHSSNNPNAASTNAHMLTSRSESPVSSVIDRSTGPETATQV